MADAAIILGAWLLGVVIVGVVYVIWRFDLARFAHSGWQLTVLMLLGAAIGGAIGGYFSPVLGVPGFLAGWLGVRVALVISHVMDRGAPQT